MLCGLDHPNIVKYLGTGCHNAKLEIVMEYIPGGSLESLLKKFGAFVEGLIRLYTCQVLIVHSHVIV